MKFMFSVSFVVLIPILNLHGESHRDIRIIRNANNILTFISINFFNIEYAIRELRGIPAFLLSFDIVSHKIEILKKVSHTQS